MARNFAGGSDRISYPAANLGTVSIFAFALRFRTTQATANTLLAARWNSSSRQGWGIILNNTAGKLLAIAYDGTTQILNTGAGATTVNDGNWHTLVFTGSNQNGQSCLLYVDSALDASGVNAGSWPLSQDINLGWGSLGFWASYVGDQADAAYWNSAQLTADEAISYHRGFSAGLIRPANQTLYAPLVRDHQARRGVFASTTLLGTTVSDHPRVIGSLV